MTIALLQGDCLELLRTMSAASVDAVIADQPYGTGQWQRAASGQGSDPTAIYSREDWDVFDLRWLTDALRVSRGPVAAFTPTNHLPTLWAYAQDHALPYRLLMWVKPDPKPRPGKQTAYGYEPIVVLRGLAHTGDKDWFLASAPRRNRDREATGHPHQKPVRLLRWLADRVLDGPGVILDPFMGSGSTGVACIETGRGFVGIEKDPAYFAIAQARIAQAYQEAA